MLQESFLPWGITLAAAVPGFSLRLLRRDGRHFHRLLAGRCGVRSLPCAAPRTHLLLAHPVQLGQTVCFEDARCAHGRCTPCFQYTTACPVLSVYKCGTSSQQGSRPLGQAPAPVSLTKRKSGRGYRARRSHPLHLANRSNRHSCLSSCLPLSGGQACLPLPVWRCWRVRKEQIPRRRKAPRDDKEGAGQQSKGRAGL